MTDQIDTVSSLETIQRQGQNPGSTWQMGKLRRRGVMCYSTVMSQDMVKLGLESDFLLHHTLWPPTMFWVWEGCVCMCMYRGVCAEVCAGVYRVGAGV